MTADGKKTKANKIIKKIHIFVRIILSISLFVDIYVLRQGSFVFHLFPFSWECLDSEPTIQPHDGGGKRPLVRPSAFFFIHFHPLVFHSFEQFIQLIQLVYQPFSFIPFPFAMIQLFIHFITLPPTFNKFIHRVIHPVVVFFQLSSISIRQSFIH